MQHGAVEVDIQWTIMILSNINRLYKWDKINQRVTY
jgi:hypothetical protein